MPVFIFFKNKDSNYLMSSVPDDVNGISYSTGPCGWIYRSVFAEMLRERLI